MSKNFSQITGAVSKSLKQLRADIPNVTSAFSALAQAAGAGGALDRKTKELIATALGVAARCDACIGFHIEALVKVGATRQELSEALGMAVVMGGGPSLMYAAEAMAAWDEYAGHGATTDGHTHAGAPRKTSAEPVREPVPEEA